MDSPVETFLKSNRKIRLQVLLQAHANLSILQLNNGCFFIENIQQVNSQILFICCMLRTSYIL